ncbi:MAG: glycosyltransferase family 2 protein, partial [Planctomycetes bacterium]|nr:glycosyltransferase family 2 protein [Planctomycetota bacterium]
TIAAVVADYLAEPHIDEVVVCDNNCRDETARLARDAGAIVVEESAPGYGCALRAGMAAATGEVIVLTEADGSFKARDLTKLLAYLPDGGMILGTRTTKQMVEQGANMGFILRWGNVTAAKILELLWYIPHEPRLTDVGCTYRVLWRRTYETIRDGLTETGPGFSPEMTCECLRHGIRVIEVPVSYHPRCAGESAHSGSMWSVVKTASKMFRCIFRKRLSRRPGRRKAHSAPAGGGKIFEEQDSGTEGSL